MELHEDQLARGRRERWWRSTFVIIATVYVSLLLIGLLLDILSGFVQIALTLFIAWLLAFVLSPLVTWMVARFRLPRGAAIGIVFGAALIIGAAFLFYAAASIAANVGDMTADFPLTRARIEGVLREWQDAITVGRFAPDLVQVYRDAERTLVGVAGPIIGEVPQVGASVLGSLALVIILSVYMLADSAGILAKLNRVIPSRYEDEVEILERTVSKAFGGFLRAQVLLAGIQTVLTVLVVLLVGLPYGFLITAASALGMLIPFFGPPLALVPPIVATAIFASDWIIPVALGLLIVQTVLVNYLQPRLMQEALGMHPLLVLVGLLIGAQVAGLWGALFGIPVIAVLNVFFNYAVNLRTLEESPEETEEVLEEVRAEAPDAPPEELVAMAADRVEAEAEEEEIEAAESVDAASDDLRAAAGELRAAAGEQREAAGQIGESAAELREASERLAEDRPS
jgi:predicted PurR-regulated permease PerM